MIESTPNSPSTMPAPDLEIAADVAQRLFLRALFGSTLMRGAASHMPILPRLSTLLDLLYDAPASPFLSLSDPVTAFTSTGHSRKTSSLTRGENIQPVSRPSAGSMTWPSTRYGSPTLHRY